MNKECDERVKRVRARWAERIKKKNVKIRELRRELRDCMKGKPKPPKPPPPPEPPEPPKPDKAIKSLKVKNGKFIVNGQPTKLYGVSKREKIAVGSEDYPHGVNYTYAEIKKAILNSNINYIRVLAGNSLGFFRQEVRDFLKHGINVEVELFDVEKPHRAWQAYWKDTFDYVKDLPVFFDAHNEFLEKDGVNTVISIVNHVVSHGGIISAGAWSGANGKKLAEKFKKKCNAYQIVSHHRDWTKRSLQESMEAGKPIVMNEIHSRDTNLQQMKALFGSVFKWGAQGVNIYPLLNWGIGQNSRFQKILDFVSDFKIKMVLSETTEIVIC